MKGPLPFEFKSLQETDHLQASGLCGLHSKHFSSDRLNLLGNALYKILEEIENKNLKNFVVKMP